MASDFDRDNSIDALLTGARRDPAPAARVEAGPACLDAETLAAWADGGLDADRVRAIEAHVADCARCQALSALFFSSDATVPVDVPRAPNAPKVVPFRRNRIMYWVPIAAGTIAATLVIWFGMRDRNELKSEAKAVIADARPAETPASAAQQGGLAPAAQQGALAKSEDAKRLGPTDPAPLQRQADRATKETATANQFRKVVPEPVASPAPAKVAAPPPAATLAMPPPPPAAVAPPTPLPGATSASRMGTQLGQGQAAGTVGGAAGVRQTSEVAKVEPRVLVEFSSLLARAEAVSTTTATTGGTARVAAGGGAGRGGRGGGGGGGGRGAGIVLDGVKAVAPPFYWRILSTDVIERSVDRLIWDTVAIDPPVHGLVSGAAPSATVCWIVGRDGLVLVTSDGKEFTRVAQPVPADLISIIAQDALRATVTTVGGQMFTTTDGGKSWK